MAYRKNSKRRGLLSKSIDRRLLVNDIPEDTIIKTTGLTKEELEKIKSEMK